MNDICPQCRVVRELVPKEQTVRKKIGKARASKLLIMSYFCSTCGVFVKSEETRAKKNIKRLA